MSKKKSDSLPVPVRRPGPTTHVTNEVARAILERVGPNSRIRNQARLREEAQVGTRQITLLRTAPEKLDPQTLVALADAVGADPIKVLRLAGKEHYASQVDSIREAHAQLHTRRSAESGRIDLPPIQFFRSLKDRAKGHPFFLAASFSAPPLAPEAQEVQEVLVDLITNSQMSFVMVVPVLFDNREQEDKERSGHGQPVEKKLARRLPEPLGVGHLAHLYQDAFRSTLHFTRWLMHRCSETDPTARERIGVFVRYPQKAVWSAAEKLPPQSLEGFWKSFYRNFLPPATSEERSFLVVFDDRAAPADRTRIVGCWARDATKKGLGSVAILHDPQPPDSRPQNLAKLNQWAEYFDDFEMAWRASDGKSLSELPSGSIWHSFNIDS